MNDLVGIAAEQKMPGTAQRFQDERELHGRYVLDFVDNHEVVTRRGFVEPFPSDQIEVEEFRVLQPGKIFFVEVIEPAALVRGEDRLAHAQGEIIFARERAALPGRNAAANFLERLMPVDVAKFRVLEGLANALKPAREIPPRRLASRRNVNGFDELPIG